jgi:hypothetical protein
MLNTQRMYHVVAIVDHKSRKCYLTNTPVTHGEGCTILRKQVPRATHRYQLEELQPDTVAADRLLFRFV